MYCGLWVPGSRAEPFFPLCPRRSSWIRCHQDSAAIPATGFAFDLRGTILTPSPPSEPPLRGNCSNAFLSVPFVGLAPDNLRRQYRRRRCKRRGGNDLVRCAMSLPEVLLRSVSQPQCSASWPANRPVAGHSRYLRRTDSTEPAIVFAGFCPIGAGKAGDADPCTQRRSDICVLSPPRSNDRRLPRTESRQTMSPRFQDIWRARSAHFMTQ